MANIVSLKHLRGVARSGVELVARMEPAAAYTVEPPRLAFAGPIEEDRPRWRHGFMAGMEAASPAVEVYRIRDALVSVGGVVMTGSSAILRESLYPYVHLPDILAAFQGGLVADEAGPESVRMVIGGVTRCWDSILLARELGEAGYFHWLHSVLPRIEIFRRMNLLPRRLGVALTEPFQQQSLDLMQFTPDDLQLSSGCATFFEELYYCTPMVFPDVTRSGGFFERALWANQMLRGLAAASQEGNAKRIYISRRDAKIRRLEQEDELVRKLDALGFVEVTLTGMPFKSQIDLFASAEMVVSMHGAGLANAAFMAPGAGLIEILAPDRLWPTYRGVAARSGLSYFPYVGERAGQRLETDSDLAVDVGHLADFTREALALSAA
jgi:hypothetical protein